MKMLRLNALFLIFAMMVCLAPQSVLVSANGGMVFDLDLSGYDAQTGEGLKNAVSGAGTRFEVEGASKPGLDSIITPLGETTEFLTFKTYEGTEAKNKDRILKIFDESFLNKEELTVSFWLYRPQQDSAWDTLMMLTGANTPPAGMGMRICPFNAAYYVYYPFSGSNDSASLTAPPASMGKWRHIVLARRYKGTGFECALYSDSEQTNFCRYQNLSGAKISEDGYYMQFGNFGGSIGDIKIYDKYLTANEVKDYYEKTKNNFIEGVNEITLTGVSCEDGTIISGGGEIEITFNNFVDPGSLSNISLTKKNGEAIDGRINAYLPEQYSKTVRLRYAELDENEEYTLTIASGVRSFNGYGTNEDYEYHLTATSTTIFYEDFEGEQFIPGEVCPEVSGLIVRSSSSAGDWQDFMVHTDEETGKKYIDYVIRKVYDDSGNQIAAGTDIKYNLPQLYRDEPIGFEIKFKASVRGEGGAGGGEGYRQILRAYSATNTTGTSREFTYTNATGGCSSTGKNDEDGKDGIPTRFDTVVGEDGWHVLRLVTGIRKSDGKRYYDYYYDANNPHVFCRITDTACNPATIGSILVASSYLYATSASAFNRIGVSIDYFKVFAPTYPQVIYAGLEDAEQNDDFMEVFFNKEINADALSQNPAYFKSDSDDFVHTEYQGYDKSSRSVSFGLNNYFLFGRTYTLFLNKLTSADGYRSMQAEAATIKIPDYEVVMTQPEFINSDTRQKITELRTVQNAAARFIITNNSAMEKSIRTFFICYDNEGRMKESGSDTFILSGAASKQAELPIITGTLVAGDYISVYCWDTTGGINKPISIEPAQILYEQEGE
jgi:hypothetical protein